MLNLVRKIIDKRLRYVRCAYFARSSADVRIIGTNMSIVNIIKNLLIHFFAISLFHYVNGSLLQDFGSGSVWL